MNRSSALSRPSEPQHPASPSGYSTKDVAALLGLSAESVRSYVRAGFLSPRQGPRGEYYFTFQDLVLLRTAKGLLAARVPRRRVRLALQSSSRATGP
jgi:DNA-binding transcriptional MerR regulator